MIPDESAKCQQIVSFLFDEHANTTLDTLTCYLTTKFSKGKWNKKVIICGDFNSINTLDVNTGVITKLVDINSYCLALTQLRNENRIVYGDFYGNVYLYDLKQHKEINQVKPVPSVIRCIKQVWNGDIIVCSQRGVILKYDQNLNPICEAQCPHKICAITQISENQMAVGRSDGVISIYDLVSLEIIKDINVIRNRAVLCIVSLLDGRLASACFSSKLINIWDTDKGECTQVIDTDYKEFILWFIQLENHRLVSCGDKNFVCIWSVYTSECLRRLDIASVVCFYHLLELANDEFLCCGTESFLINKQHNVKYEQLEKSIYNAILLIDY
jgi:WD40 repeat protein